MTQYYSSQILKFKPVPMSQFVLNSLEQVQKVFMKVGCTSLSSVLVTGYDEYLNKEDSIRSSGNSQYIFSFSKRQSKSKRINLVLLSILLQSVSKHK